MLWFLSYCQHHCVFLPWDPRREKRFRCLSYAKEAARLVRATLPTNRLTVTPADQSGPADPAAARRGAGRPVLRLAGARAREAE